jgi:hypothetical protein
VALNSNNVDSSRVCILANKIAFILLQVFEWRACRWDKTPTSLAPENYVVVGESSTGTPAISWPVRFSGGMKSMCVW